MNEPTDVLEVELAGSLDARTTPDLRAKLYGLIDAPGRLVVLDLALVTSADVVALRVIAGVSRLASLHGDRVVLRAVPAPVRRLLTVSRLARLVEIEREAGAFAVPQPLAGVTDVASATPETT